MSFQSILGIVGAMFGGGVIGVTLQHLRERRKSNAEGALLEEEVLEKGWGRFQAEIARLDKAILECDSDKQVLNKKVRQQDNEIAMMRHRINNEVMSTEALLMIIESHVTDLPTPLVQAIAGVRKFRAEQQAFIAFERAANVQVRMDLDKAEKEENNEPS